MVLYIVSSERDMLDGTRYIHTKLTICMYRTGGLYLVNMALILSTTSPGSTPL